MKNDRRLADYIEAESIIHNEKYGDSFNEATSQAISLKRIADALEQLVLFHLGTGEK